MAAPIPGTYLSLRFKYGIHTIFMFVDPMESFEKLGQTLLEVLEERYPDGITATKGGPQTPLPEAASLIEFGVLKSSTDPDQGWKLLNVQPADTVVSKAVKSGMALAFAFKESEDDETVHFEVEWPTYEEEDEMEAMDEDDDPM